MNSTLSPRRRITKKARLPIQLTEEAMLGISRIADARGAKKPSIVSLIVEEAARTNPDDFVNVLAAISKFRTK